MRKSRILAVVVVVIMMVGLFAGCKTKEPSVEASAAKVEKVSDEEKPENAVKQAITINIKADRGWDKDSTPAIAHIKSRTDKKTDFYHAVKPGKDGGTGMSEVELAEGTYTVEFVSPVNKDGSAYEIYDTGKAQEITIKADSKEEIKIDCPMKQIPADKVTDEMVKEIVKKTQEAVEKGDSTLKGDAGKEVLGKLDKNVEANPNVSKETKDKAEEGKENMETKTETKTEANKGQAEAAPKTDSQASTSNTGNTGNAGNSTPAKTEPVHVHEWIAHTVADVQWVPNIVTVPDYATQTTYVIVCNCGATFTDNASHEAHAVAHVLAGEASNYWTEAQTTTVQVGSHTEDHGSYQQVGTKVDYYYCACGATQ